MPRCKALVGGGTSHSARGKERKEVERAVTKGGTAVRRVEREFEGKNVGATCYRRFRVPVGTIGIRAERDIRKL